MRARLYYGLPTRFGPIVRAKSHSFSDRTGRLSDCHRRIDMFLEARVVIFLQIYLHPAVGWLHLYKRV
jgi:hypothetical protein